MSDLSNLELENEIRNQIYRDKYIPQILARVQKVSPYYKLRKYYRNRIRAWKSQQRKIAKAQQLAAPARRRRLCRGIKPRAEEQNSSAQEYKPLGPSQMLRQECKEAIRRWRLQQVNQPAPSQEVKSADLQQQDEATSTQLPGVPARKRRLVRGIKPRPRIQLSPLQFNTIAFGSPMCTEYRQHFRSLMIEMMQLFSET
ncbi:hypothetical protein EAE96_000978 [Botrytis aclada]|nr:hypothetical protein EAE96_000978 [Botrytis aclada]